MGWPQSAEGALALLGKAAHHGDGALICSAADCLLRGQWEAVAALERPSPFHVLAVASSRRSPAHRPRTSATPAGPETEFALFKLTHYPCRHYVDAALGFAADRAQILSRRPAACPSSP